MAAFDIANYQKTFQQNSLAAVKAILEDFLQKNDQIHYQFVPLYVAMLQKINDKPELFLEDAPQAISQIRRVEDSLSNPFLVAIFPFARHLRDIVSREAIKALEIRELLDVKARLLKANATVTKQQTDPDFMLDFNAKLLGMKFCRKAMLPPHHGTDEKTELSGIYRTLVQLCKLTSWTTTDMKTIIALLERLQEVSQIFFKESKERHESLRASAREAIANADPQLLARMPKILRQLLLGDAQQEDQQEDQQESALPSDTKEESS